MQMPTIEPPTSPERIIKDLVGVPDGTTLKRLLFKSLCLWRVYGVHRSWRSIKRNPARLIIGLVVVEATETLVTTKSNHRGQLALMLTALTILSGDR